MTVALLMTVVMAAACGGKKPEKKIIVHKPKPVKPAAVKSMGDYTQQMKAEIDGEEYTISLNFRADTTLATVAEEGQKYYDNRTTLRITRPDGSELIKRDFSKADFSSFLDATATRDGAFLGLVFYKGEDGRFIFAASVGSPDKSSDDYTPLVVKVSRGGAVDISRDTQLDIGDE